MAGRRPKPTRLKLITGNPGRRPLYKREPKPRLAIPSAPRHLNPAARAEWKRISRQLYDLGLLTQIDRAALAMYCQAYGRWVFAEQKLKDEKMLLVKSPTDAPMQNPWLGIANRSMRQMQSLLSEFGLSPSSRSRIVTGEPPAARDPFDVLLDG
jgi:P27 family predicted phage terminase small subunit